MASRGDPRRGDSPDEDAGPEERALTAGAANLLPPEISGLHVLVVDDDPLCLKIVGKMLRSCGYSVTTADGGKAALSPAQRALGSSADTTSATRGLNCSTVML